MEYEWDPAKADANFLKHGVSFEDVVDFDWRLASTAPDDRRAYGEARFIAVGPIGDRLHVLIFTRRSGGIRVISLRRANDRESRRHERTKKA